MRRIIMQGMILISDSCLEVDAIVMSRVAGKVALDRVSADDQIEWHSNEDDATPRLDNHNW